MLKWKRLALAGLAVGGALMALPAGATGTPAGTSILNRAQVNYTVGGVAQTQVNSSPAGNSTPGAGGGADTTFVVDRVVNYTLTTVDSSAIIVTPGQTAQVTTYLVTNTGNGLEGFALSGANLTGVTVFGNADTIDVTPASIKVYYGPDATSAFNIGTATLGNLDNLAADGARRVFVVADIPVAAANGAAANVSLTARAAVAGTAGATLETATAGGDTAGVDVVLAVAGNTRSSNSGYLVQAPVLTVTKTQAVISDPVNNVTNPKAIPGAIVEYTVTIANASTTQGAAGVAILDPIAAQLALQQGVYNAGASNVSITVGTAATRYCLAEAGADGNADGCNFASGSLNVGGAAAITLGTTATTNSAVVKFQVKIN